MKLLVIQDPESGALIPEGGLILWGGETAPDTWSFNTVFDDCFVMGGSYNVTLQGALTHTHSMPNTAVSGSHTNHDVLVGNSGPPRGTAIGLDSSLTSRADAAHKHNGGSGVIATGGTHSHTVSGTDAGSNLPPYVRLRWIQGGTEIPVGGIVMRNTASGLPDGWAVCDGENGTPDMRGRFVYGGTGADGGSDKHKHTVSGGTTGGGSHTHTVNVQSADSNDGNNASPNNPTVSASTPDHSHTVTVSSETSNPATHAHSVNDTSEDTVLPPYITAYYIMRKA